MMDLPERFETEGGPIRFAITGQGPPVVFVHGTPWSSFTWRHIIPAVAADHSVYIYDLLGYGQSGMGEGQDVSLDRQGRIFADLLQFWNLAEPVVVAHDFGGAISLRAHLLHGCEFKHLCLMNVVAMAPWGSPFFAHVREHEAAFAGVPPYIHAAILEAYIKGALHKTLLDEEMAGLLSPWLSDEGQRAFYRQIAQADQRFTDEVEPLYDTIRCPVTILWGEQDGWIPIETGRRLHAAIKGSDFYPVPDAGHLVQMDQPERVRAHILDLLGGG